MTAPTPRKRIPTPLLIGGGVAGALGIYLYVKSKRTAAAATATAPVDTTGGTTDTTGYDTSQAYGDYSGAYGNTYGATPGAYQYVAGVGSVTQSTLPTTNFQWTQQAVSLLSQEGFDTMTATVALGKYLSGQGLSSTEMETVQAAIAVAGTPPVSVTPPHLSAPSGQTQPLASNQYKIQATDTITSISKQFYGAATSTELNSLRAANPFLRGVPSTLRLTLFAGRIITIPVPH